MTTLSTAIKLLTDVARRIEPLRLTLHLIFQSILRAQKRWRRINVPYLETKVLEGVKLEDGIDVKKTKNNQTGKYAA